MAIIAIFASLAVPVVLNQNRRQIDHAAEQIADLLLMYAQRESMHPDPPGLSYNPATHSLHLLTLPDPEEGLDQGWVEDQYVDPVILPDFVELTQVAADGEAVDISAWPLGTRINEDRPAIAITIEGADRIITIELAPHALGPRIIEYDAASGPVRQPLDLDGLGRSREDW